MKNNRICVIHSNAKIEALYTLFPLLTSKYSHLITFLNLESKEARQAEGECVILVRVFKGNKDFSDDIQKKRDYIIDFKKRFNRVVMLDDSDGSDSLHYEYMDLVDLYFKGKLLKKKEGYLKPVYGRQLFSDYYNNKFGIVDEKVKWRDVPDDPAVLNKLRISWNLGYGIYPMPNSYLIKLARSVTHYNISKVLKPWFVYSYKKMLDNMSKPVDYSKKVNKVHARFGSNALPNTIGYQRRIFLQKCQENRNTITGKVKPEYYKKEISQVGAVLSPFGWGEVCFRDFEAIMNGSLLIKPNMDHIETWPDVYRSSTTYLPINWDGDDLLDTIDQVTDNIKAYTSIMEGAKETYKKSLLELDNKVLNFLEEASSTRIEEKY
jgi:hypothetical protein